MNSGCVASLHVYPVKSLGPVAVDRATVAERGFADDRRWMVVDEDGRFLTQRTHPKLAVVKTALDGGKLCLQRPGARPLVVADRLADGRAVTVQIWGDRCGALDAGDRAARWLGQHLGVDCRLVFMPETTRRRANCKADGDEAIVSFADSAPFLLIEQASLNDLNARLEHPAPMNRFRPNIVVGGTAAFAADRWAHIRIGDVDFDVCGPCARCAVTRVDQDTGRRGVEPLDTLASYRSRPEGVCFGQYLIHQHTGAIGVGDQVEVVATKSRLP